MADPRDAVSMIAAVPFFSELDGKRRRTMAARGKELRYEAGGRIVREGDMGVGFYLILEGRAEVRRKGRVLASLAAGQFFGEMSLIDEKPRTADVVAVEPTRCWTLTSWAFSALVKTNPELAVGMLKEMVKRLRDAQSSPTA